MDSRLADMPKPQPAQHQSVFLRGPDGTPPQRNPNAWNPRLVRSIRFFIPHEAAALSCRSPTV